MSSPFPIQYVDKSDPRYQELPHFQVVLKPQKRGSTARKYLAVAYDLIAGIEASDMSDSIASTNANGQELTLDFIKGQITEMISECPIEWIRGCDGVSIIHPPGKIEKLASILSKLPLTGWASAPRNTTSIQYKGEVYVLKVRLYMNKLFPPDRLLVMLDNPSDPGAVHLVPKGQEGVISLSATLDTKKKMEVFAIDKLKDDLHLNYGIPLSDLCYRHEPLGKDTFPDFELKVSEQLWGVEVTRIESGMVSYIKLGEEVKKERIRDAVQKPVTQYGVGKVLQKAMKDKTRRRNQCSKYFRFCLLLVDIVDSVNGKEFRVWEGIDLSAFEVIALVKFDGSVSYIKGSLVPDSI